MTRPRRQAGASGLAALLLFLASQPVSADGPLYKSTDVAGRTIYTDHPASPDSKPVRNRMAPDPSAARYREALTGTESERILLQRSYLEDAQRRKVVIYDPPPGYLRRESPLAEPGVTSYRRVPRWDANLPPTPPPSLERNYYYNGR